MSRNCSTCHKPMYEHSDGASYSCRNFDCPPGNQKAHQDSWKIKEELRPKLLQCLPIGLTIEEIGTVLNDSADRSYGPALQDIAKKLGVLLELRKR